ncbi:MAG TPA: L-aspartate oxidase [Bdellovibrionota bacterium]|nr:L-aspartate oxidase [Bdellovibrionota bacterium]
MTNHRIETDCLIIGTGMAGCTAALELADMGIRVTMITRAEKPADTASSMAQGGIMFHAEGDNPAQLKKEIEQAGAGICNPAAVELIATEGPAWVEKILMKHLQVPFDRNDDGSLSLTGEAAHGLHRILHCGDQTGAQIERAFLQEISGKKTVTILTEHTAVDLLTLSHHSLDPRDIYKSPRCVGAYVLDRRKSEVITILAKETILATGGLGQLYLHTTNPAGARGDGLAMAYRTGARIMNLEYVQFHPTALYRETPERFLISEALRGEGARLINRAGAEFMKRYDDRGALAPRDIVARAIHDEMLREGSEWVYLDISHKPADWIKKRFPSIYKACLASGIDMTQKPVPVVPAAHYSCGGVAVDLDGNTTIQNLKAIGEVACSGVHGGNRLASTSLLEDLVWGVRAAQNVQRRMNSGRYDFPDIRLWEPEMEAVDRDLLTQDWMTIKHTMWNYVGLVRTPKRLERAQRILRDLADEIEKFYGDSALSDELIGLRNGATVAQLILTAARRNHSSIGCHYLRSD